MPDKKYREDEMDMELEGLGEEPMAEPMEEPMDEPMAEGVDEIETEINSAVSEALMELDPGATRAEKVGAVIGKLETLREEPTSLGGLGDEGLSLDDMEAEEEWEV